MTFIILAYKMTVTIFIVKHTGWLSTMGTSKADKARNHDQIVDIAAAKIRALGIDGLGLAALMKDVGLTHGGFYRHFSSRDELIEAAMEKAMEQGGQRFGAATSLSRLIGAYLSQTHRDDPNSNCAVCSLANDVARGGARLRKRYAEQVQLYLSVLEGLDETGAKPQRRARAIHALSAMVGGLALARAINEPALSDEILQVCANQVRRIFE